MQNKNQLALELFMEYCQKHPEQRFWQALRNWATLETKGEISFIAAGRSMETLEDTYYWVS